MARIVIVGGGIGGLALAHGARAHGLDVTVLERDPSSEIRGQGFRLHLDDDGNAALAACLPAAVHDAVRHTAGINGHLVSGWTSGMRETFRQPFPEIGEHWVTHVDRQAFRRALLTGLDDVVTFGAELTAVTTAPDGRVRAVLAGGGEVDGDLLVGADGVGSVVRRGLLPAAAVRDTGVRCLYGRLPVTDERRAALPPAFADGFAWIADPAGYGAGIAPMFFRHRVGHTGDYLMTVLATTPARLGVTDAALGALAPPAVHALTVDATASWHPAVRDLFRGADPASFFPIVIRAAEPVAPWPSGPVTLLGDAVHAMPPAGGVGANTALRDAALLTRELGAAARGDIGLLDAVARYEAEMLPHGNATVARSVEQLATMLAPDAAA